MNNLLLEHYRKLTGHNLPLMGKTVALPARTVLYQPEQRPQYVHLLLSGLASIVTTTRLGQGVEVGGVGRESFPESQYLLGPQPAPRRCFMQVAGTAFRIRFSLFEEAFQCDPPLRNLALQCAQYESFTASQLLTCSALHNATQRLARWLLAAHQRLQDDCITVTQDCMAQMLGVQRSTVVAIAGQFQTEGAIHYRRGFIRILNREHLQRSACECSAVIHGFYNGIYRPADLRDLATPHTPLLAIDDRPSGTYNHLHPA